MDPETADEDLQALVLVDKSGPNMKFVHHSIYTDLPATNAYDRQRYATTTDTHQCTLMQIQEKQWK